jgi:hypothetical protein
MRVMRTVGILLLAVVTLGVFVASTLAQTSGGAFSQLSPGQQKIVRALYEAQSRSTAANAPKPLTLDEIASMKKKNHEGWGQVFKDMKRQGLVSQKSLGDVVSSYERRHPESAKLDRNVDKPEKVEKPDKPEKPDKAQKPEKPAPR